MSVLLEAGMISLRENCPVEDAEPLLILLQKHPDFPVSIGDATHLHAAVLQVLLAFRRKLIGRSQDPFHLEWIVPVLADGTEGPN